MEPENPLADEPLAMIFEAENMLEAGDIEQTLTAEDIHVVMQANVTPGLLPVDFGSLGGVGGIKMFVLQSQQDRAKAIIEDLLRDRPPADSGDAAAGEDAGEDDA